MERGRGGETERGRGGGKRDKWREGVEEGRREGGEEGGETERGRGGGRRDRWREGVEEGGEREGRREEEIEGCREDRTCFASSYCPWGYEHSPHRSRRRGEVSSLQKTWHCRCYVHQPSPC